MPRQKEVFLQVKAKYGLFLPILVVSALALPAGAVESEKSKLSPDEAERLAKFPAEDQYFLNIAREGFYSFRDTTMPLRVFVRPVSIRVSSDQTKGMQSAFDEWSKATDGRLKFQFIPSDTDPDITVIWTENPNDLREGKQGYTDFKTPKDNVVKATITLLTKWQSVNRPIDSAFMKVLTLHEIGHAIGLNGHSIEHGDIMFGGILDNASCISPRDLKFQQKIYSTNRQDLLLETLPNLEKIYGEESKSVARNLYRIARIYNEKKQFAQAEPYCKRALIIEDKLLPDNDRNHVSTLAAVAYASWHLDKFAQAQPCYERMLRLKRSGVSIHMSEQQLLLNIARCQEEQNQIDKSMTTLTELAALLQKTSPQSEDRAFAMGKLAYLKFKKGEKEEARPLIKSACEIYAKAPESKGKQWCLNFYRSQYGAK